MSPIIYHIMVKRQMFVNCSSCPEVYEFAVFNKAKLTIHRTGGGFCHSCFSEYCPECFKKRTNSHSPMDDEDLCQFKLCKLEGAITCMLCVQPPIEPIDEADPLDDLEEAKHEAEKELKRIKKAVEQARAV